MVLGLAYRTGVPWNESHWSNAKFDELLSKAEGILDPVERSKVMAEIETLMLEEGPACIPLWRAVFTAMDKKLKGFQAHPTSYLFAEEWSLEA
jgi:peptide/nickel transport system substrate-binding protein